MSFYKIANKEHRYIVISIALIAIVISAPLLGATSFTDVSKVAGVDHKAPSFGVSWGDFNGDGWPDIWVGNHYQKPSLFLNQGNGLFVDIIDKVWSGNPTADAHGVAWADMDNDGDQDLIEQVGGGSGVGRGPNHLYINDQGNLQEAAIRLGVDQPLGRGRTPLWLDADLDGRLDLVLMTAKRPDGNAPSSIYSQSNNKFFEANDKFNFRDPNRSSSDKLSDLFYNIVNLRFGLPTILYGNLRLATLSDFTGNGEMELISFAPMRINTIGQRPFDDVTYDFTFPKIKDIQDVAIADFNGDLKPDIYLTRSSGAADINVIDNEIHAQLRNKNAKSISFIKFRSTGDLQFLIGPHGIMPREIYLGGKRNSSGKRNITVSPKDAQTIQAESADLAKVLISYNPKNDIWLLKSQVKELRVIIISKTSIELVDVNGATDDTGAMKDKLLINQSMKFVSRAMGDSVEKPNACNSVVAEDFDNDMDIDIYLVCSRPSGNIPNIYLDNQGDGKFKFVENAGGAQGTEKGLGESVAAADYDQDGFIDLFVTNGAGTIPFAEEGRHQLFHNNGNSNHWIEIDLQGVQSNADGIGAYVIIEAGGVMQLREQSGGMHRNSQNDKRLHFGLGKNKLIDSITVYWPSGLKNRFNQVKADKIIIIKESQTEKALKSQNLNLSSKT